MTRQITVIFSLTALLIFIGCSKEKETTSTVPVAPTYVGSGACRTCHAEIYAEFSETGHKSGLGTVTGGIPPAYPDTVQPADLPPAGYSWGDISYVVGGFGWKTNFVDAQGYLVTGSETQWNLETQAWAAYDSNLSPGTKSFDCARCHTTGYEFSENGHQGGLPGIIGTWAENGVTCERCHGPGGQHVFAPGEHGMQIDDGSELCGECHYGSEDYRIKASDGLIMHNQQYSELISAGHANIPCALCHDPHRSAKYDAQNAIIAACTDCHNGKVVDHPGPDDCVLCHMPKSVLSAVPNGSGIYLRGDMRSHIFRINADISQGQFYPDGADMYSEGFNGLNFSCLSSCHGSESLAWAESNAGSIHP